MASESSVSRSGLEDAGLEEARRVLAEVKESLATQIPETEFLVLSAKKQSAESGSDSNWYLAVKCTYSGDGHGEEVAHICILADGSKKYSLVAVLRGLNADSELKLFSEESTGYDYHGVHWDLEHDLYAGSYGWDNAAYHAIAERKAKVDLHKFHGRRTADECYIDSFVQLLRDPRTHKNWHKIATFDPFGMTSTRPTIAATTAILNIPELRGKLRVDDEFGIVNADGSVNTKKAAVYYAWNLPLLAERLGLSETGLRDSLFKYTRDTSLLNPKVRTFLPQVGGMTVYTFGDIRKLRDARTKVAVRVHDECNGSDVFGTDICTCRPYLVFALKATVECAQLGGVGVVVYFRKEGRSLGEVTKYRVYNARKNQSGGDSAEKYFFQTESIAGIRDARFQEMMPDVLNWLGIDRIDYLMSMSNEKYDAILAAGVRVDQRIPLPDMYVPKHAQIELSAKIASGYHVDDGTALEGVIDEVLGLKFVRKQCTRLFQMCIEDKLENFAYDESKLEACADVVIAVTKRRYPDLNVPMHSRLRHFPASFLDSVTSKWKTWGIDKLEMTRRVIDLVFVSVLLDAGAGPVWRYITHSGKGKTLSRSEGLANASIDMFLEGIFSSDEALCHRVNALGLQKLTAHQLQVGFQVTSSNPMVGLKGRVGLLNRLGKCLRQFPEYFGHEVARPGNVLDYVLKHAEEVTVMSDECCAESGGGALPKWRVSVHVLWAAISRGLVDMWPERAFMTKKGDVWFHRALKQIGQPGSDQIAFHKLQQWLCYSVVEVLSRFGVQFTEMSDMTALAEYRNGGLLVDTGVLVPKRRFEKLDVGSVVTVEWRALTVICIDKLAAVIRKKLGKTEEQLPLANILEGGTWQAGRDVARDRRENGAPPFTLISDGTVF